MQPLRIGPYHLLYDAKATRTAHALRRNDSCTCAHCRNWAVARHDTYANPAFRQLLDTLGVPLDGETEVCQYARLDSGMHGYSGWFHFVGLITGREDDPGHDDPPGRLHPLLTLSAKRDVLPPSLAGFSVVQLDIHAEVPWVLNEPDPG